MKKLKLTSLVLSFALMLTLLTACGGKSSVRDDVAVKDLSETVCASLDNPEDMMSVDETYIKSSMKMDISSLSEYDVRVNSRGTAIDEYGVFKGEDEEQTTEIEDIVKSYIQMCKDTWMSEYRPEELPKLENATVKTMGNYVIYFILSDEAKENAENAFVSALTE